MDQLVSSPPKVPRTMSLRLRRKLRIALLRQVKSPLPPASLSLWKRASAFFWRVVGALGRAKRELEQ